MATLTHTFPVRATDSGDQALIESMVAAVENWAIAEAAQNGLTLYPESRSVGISQIAFTVLVDREDFAITEIEDQGADRASTVFVEVSWSLDPPPPPVEDPGKEE